MTSERIKEIAIGLLIVAMIAGVWKWHSDAMERAVLEERDKWRVARIGELEKSQQERTNQANKAVAVIEKKAAAVKTPEQAIAAIPDVAQIPLTIHQFPITGDYGIPVQQVLPLYQELAKCQVNGIRLQECTGNLADEKAQNKLLTASRDEWKAAKKPGFLQNLWTCAVKIGVPSGVGAGFGGKKGAIAGAGAGAVSCFLK